MSQPTVSRALAPLVQAGQVQKVGAARSQRYVLPRTVRGVGREVPVMRVDEQGQASPFARLVPLARRCHLGGRGRRPEPAARRPALVSGRHAPTRLHGPHLCPCPPRAAAGHRPAPLERRRRAARPGPVWRRPAWQPGGGRGGVSALSHPAPARLARRVARRLPAHWPSRPCRARCRGSSAGGEQPKFCTAPAAGAM